MIILKVAFKNIVQNIYSFYLQIKCAVQPLLTTVNIILPCDEQKLRETFERQISF